MAKTEQTVKFVYNSKVGIIDKVRQGSSDLVTSSGIFKAIREMSSSALLDSGYVADCIISIKRNSVLNLDNGEVSVGSDDTDSMFFIPDGFDDDGVTPKFRPYRLPAGQIIQNTVEENKIRHNHDEEVTNCDLAVLIDTEKSSGPEILLYPCRVEVPSRTGEPGFRQYIFARYQNEKDPSNQYGPRTDKQTLADAETIWWDLTENKIKERINNNWVPRNYSIPIGLLSYVDGNIVGFANDFTVAGYLENAVWINPGVTFNFPSGRNLDETSTLICNPKTTGEDEQGELTYQPIMKVLLYSSLADKPQEYIDNLIAVYVDKFGNKYEGKEDIVNDSFQSPYFYDPIKTQNNTISFLKLKSRCLDVNTLSVYYKHDIDSEFVKVDPSTYTLANDAKTIVFSNPLVILESDSERATLEDKGGMQIKADFYECEENVPLFVTDSWEILGPTNAYTFDNTSGFYTNLAGNQIVGCRFAVASSGYIVQKNLSKEEPLNIVVFTPRTCFTLADNDDIENIIALIGSATGETMDQVLTNIEEIEANIEELEETLRKLITDTADTIVRTAESTYVHNTGNESIGGVKTFRDGIIGNLNGEASSVHKNFNALEILPMGVPVKYTDSGHGTSGAGAFDASVMGVNDIKTDGTLTVKCIAANVSAEDSSDIPVRQPSTNYNTGDNYKIAEDNKYKIFEVISGTSMDIDTHHVYTNDDPINVMYTNNMQVRIGSDYVKAPWFKGTATQAQWADLAEIYEADADYEPGTLIMFGGEKEITLANFGYAHGVISSKPAYLMNAEGKGLPVAMIGKVPVRVFGAIDKFDKIYMNLAAPGTATRNGTGEPLGIALETNEFAGEKLVMCVVKLKI